jgi:hypothetical protein
MRVAGQQSNLLAGHQAVEGGHADVEQHKPSLELAGEGYSLVAVGGEEDAQTCLFQHRADDAAEQLIVFGNDHAVSDSRQSHAEKVMRPGSCGLQGGVVLQRLKLDQRRFKFNAELLA